MFASIRHSKFCAYLKHYSKVLQLHRVCEKWLKGSEMKVKAVTKSGTRSRKSTHAQGTLSRASVSVHTNTQKPVVEF